LFIVHRSSFIVVVHETNESLRKALHIAFGLCAISLKWLPWWLAAAVAAAAVIGNWLVLPRIFGRQVSRHERGFDAGTIIYPLAVLVLILVFRHDLHVAGLAWAALAFGDGFATVFAKRFGGPTLPWHDGKRWSGVAGFIVTAFPALLALSLFLRQAPPWLPRWLVILIIVVIAAVAESLPVGVDDNITVPFAAAIATVLFFTSVPPRFNLDGTAMRWLLVNTGLAVIGYLAHSVDLSGMIGGWILGAILIVCGWPSLYLVLLAFFVLGTASTKLGYRRKASLGLAQEKGGRRGFGHAFANVGVATICAAAMASRGGVTAMLWWAAVASLATAAADTVASEVGQLIGRRTFLPTTFRPVPRGTEGAISVEGTVAGLIAAAAVAAVGAAASPLPGMNAAVVAFVTLCAFAGSYVESIAGNWNRTHDLRIANGALNFFNTAAGASFLMLGGRWLH
jgi:uncharacterized protein (TIGR00297 family)